MSSPALTTAPFSNSSSKGEHNVWSTASRNTSRTDCLMRCRMISVSLPSSSVSISIFPEVEATNELKSLTRGTAYVS